MPKTTVLMPARNVAKYVEAALRSVQMIADDIDIQVLDDASSDSTWDLVRQVADSDPRVKIHQSTERMGQVMSRKTLLERSDSEYLLFVDSDDVYLSCNYEKQARLLDEHREIDVVYGKMQLMDEALRECAGVLGKPFSHFSLAYYNSVGVGGTMARRSSVVNAGGFLETGFGKDSICPDYFLWWRMAAKGGVFHFIDEFIYLYRPHGSQMSKQGSGERIRLLSQFMWDYIISHNKGLFEDLITGRELSLSKKDIPVAVLLLSIISRKVPMDSPDHNRILDLVCRYSPRIISPIC
jgi:glycosyltransferase involved in cell wall biosynthesis